jgi:hypothetical protein
MTSKAEIKDEINDKKIEEEVGKYGKLFDVSGYTTESKRTYRNLVKSKRLHETSFSGYSFNNTSSNSALQTNFNGTGKIGSMDPCLTIVT